MKIISSFIIIACLTLTSCEKEASLEPTNSANSKSTSVFNKNSFTITVENPDNPWDSVGIYHNQKLDEWIATYTGDGTTQPFDECHFVSEGLEDLGNINTPNPTVNTMIDYLENNLETILSSTLSIEAALDSATASARAAYFAGQLATLFTEAVRSTKNFEQHINDIKSLEAEIIADEPDNENLTESDVVILLMACSVGRHSSAYWNNVLHTTTPWEKFEWYEDGVNEPSPALSWYAKDLEAFAYTCMANMIIGPALVIATGGVGAGGMILGAAVTSGIASAR